MGRMTRKKKPKKDKAKAISVSQMELAAFHEAGHAVIDLILGIPFVSVSISVEEMENGIMVGGVVETDGSKRPHSAVIMSLFAGKISEDIRCGKSIKLTDSETSTRDNQWALSAAIDYCFSNYEALKFMEWCHARATNLLTHNWIKIERFAFALMEKGTLSYGEARTIFSESKTAAPEAKGSTIRTE
jgi:ATP-dependent Zn protease